MLLALIAHKENLSENAISLERAFNENFLISFIDLSPPQINLASQIDEILSVNSSQSL